MMNFVLSKLQSLFDNFSHISYWRNSLKNTSSNPLKRQILVPGLHIRKSQISDCCFWVYLPLEQIIVNGIF